MARYAEEFTAVFAQASQLNGTDEYSRVKLKS